jgi:hypothetical protein
MAVLILRLIHGTFPDTSSMWKLKVPSRVHIFLWLLANNKTLTRDNLAKSKTLEYKTYVFGLESESVHHFSSVVVWIK